jgi:hypothetical protein
VGRCFERAGTHPAFWSHRAASCCHSAEKAIPAIGVSSNWSQQLGWKWLLVSDLSVVGAGQSDRSENNDSRDALDDPSKKKTSPRLRGEAK